MYCPITAINLTYFCLVFTKQDPDAESESAPPRRSIGSKITSIDQSEGLLLTDSQIKMRYAQSEGAPSTIETYLHSISEESVERYDTDSRSDGRDVDLELYNSSPKKYRKSPIDAALYSESAESMYPEHWYVRGMPDPVLMKASGQFLSRDCPHPPDILTTRVCVELGLVPSSNSMGAEANIIVEAPSVVLCNVDIEPCEVVELQNNELIKRVKEPIEIKEPLEAKEEKGEAEAEMERKQPEGREKSNVLAEGEDDDDNLDGMLDRISHDLDYLLNRNVIPEIQVTPAVPICHARKTSKPPGSSVRGQIKEEDEEQEEVSGKDAENGIGKTAC